MKIPFIITLLILITSNTLTAQNHNSIQQNTIDNFTYFEPIFVHKNPKMTDRYYNRFEELSIIALDSVFERKKPQYRIDSKNNYILTEVLENELLPIFNSESLNQPNILPTPSITAIKKTTTNRYGLFISITTESSLATNTTPISKIQLGIVIMDLVQNEVVFYGKSRNLSPIGNGGYAHVEIKNLNKIYKRINKL